MEQIPDRGDPLSMLHRDERGIVISWLVKLAVGFAVAGVLIFDTATILVNFFTLDSTADEIAITLTTGVTRLDPRDVEREAEILAEEAGARLIGTRIEEQILYVTVRRRAQTLVVGKIPWTKDWARSTAEGQAGVI